MWSRNAPNPTRYVGSGIKGVRSDGWGLGSQLQDQGSQAMGMGSGSAVFLKDRRSSLLFLWDQGSKFVTLFNFESRIRNLGTKMGSMTRKTYLVATV